DTLAPGTYTLLANVDPFNTVVESTRADNVAAAAAPTRVTSKPTDTTPPTAVLGFSPGQGLVAPATLTITATFSEALARPPVVRLASANGQLLGGTMTRDPASPAGQPAFFILLALTAANNGVYTLSLEAADLAGNLLARQPDGNWLSVTIPMNHPPLADAGPTRVVRTGTLVQLSGSARDPDLDPLTYSWSGPATVPLANSATLTPSFTAATASRFTFTLTANDGRGGVSADSVDITVTQPNTGLHTDFLQLSGLARLESGEPPAAGSRVQASNSRKGTQCSGLVDPDSGFFRLELRDLATGDAAASGDTLALTLFNPDSTQRRLLRPSPPELLLADDDIQVRQGVVTLDLVGEGTAGVGAVLLTIAGNGTPSFSGDSGQATSAALNVALAIAYDASGNLYIADAGNARVRRVTPAGVITTVAGNGKPEFSGDGGAAIQAGIGLPVALAVSADNVLYLADRSNHRVRRVALGSGAIATLAGVGSAGYSGDGAAATLATLNQPRGLLLRDATHLLVADWGNGRVREIDLTTGIIRTVAGNGLAASSGDGGAATAASINGPAGLGLDSLNRLPIAESNGHPVRRVDFTTGNILTLAGTGRAGFSPDGTSPEQAELAAPVCVIGKPSGDVLVAERDNNRIRLIEVVAGRIQTVAGNGQRGFSADGTPAPRAALGAPQGLAIATSPGGEIVLADTANHRVRKLVTAAATGPDDHPDTAAGTGPVDTVSVDALSPVTGQLERPGDVDFFRFSTVAGRAYTLRTVLGTLDDTVLALFDSDGVTTLTENDDAAGTRASVIEGFRPRAAGTYFARVRGFQSRATGTYGLDIVSTPLSTQPQLVTTGLPDAVVGQPYGLLLEVAGGTPPYRWTVVGGQLPPSLTLDSAGGLVSGTPPVAGNFRFGVVAKDIGGHDASGSFALAVRPAGAAGFPESPHPYPNGSDDSRSLTLAGTPAFIRVVFDERTSVEPGFDFFDVLDGNGVPVPGSPFTGRELTGRAVLVPGATVRVRLRSDASVSGFGWRIVEVTAADAVTETIDITPAALPGAFAGGAYSAQLFAPGAAAPLRWSRDTARDLPPGIMLDTGSGLLSGLTTSAGDFPVTVKVRDSAGHAGARRFVLPVFSSGGALYPESRHPYPDASEDLQSYRLPGNPAAILVSFDPRSELEPGFDFLHVTDADGTPVPGSPFTGRRLASQTLRIRGSIVRLRLVSDSAVGGYGYRVTQIVAAPPAPETIGWATPSTLAAARLGFTTAQPLAVLGGVPPYRFHVIGGRLPSGLSLDEDSGTIEGAAAAAGSFAFRLRVTDSQQSPASDERDFTLRVIQQTSPGLTLSTSESAGALRVIVRLEPLPEPLARVTLLVRFDPDSLEAPRLSAGDAAGSTPVHLENLGGGSLRLQTSGPPDLVRTGPIFVLDFDLRARLAAGRQWLTVVASDLVSARGQTRLARPTADAGIDRRLRVRFLAGSTSSAPFIGPAVPDPLGGLSAFIRLDGRESSDPNRPPRPLTYAWQQTAGTTATLSGAATATPTFVPPRAGDYGFSLTVNDGMLDSPASEVHVSVTSENAAPTAQIAVSGASAGDFFVAGRNTVTLDGTVSTDPDPLDAPALHYRWTQTKGRKLALLDVATGQPSTTAPKVRFVPAAPGRAGFELVVTDPQGASSPPATAEMLARPEDWHTPRLSLQSSATSTSDSGEDFGEGDDVKSRRSLRVKIPTRVTLRALLDDPDVDKPPLKHGASFAWRQIEGPSVRLDETVRADAGGTVSTVSFEPTTSRVHVFECVVSKLDESGSPTGIDVKRQVRVIVDSDDNSVPEAAFDMIQEPTRRSKAAMAVGKVAFTCSSAPRLTFVRPGARIRLDGTCSTDRGVNPRPLVYRWVQREGPPVLLSSPFGAVTTFGVPAERNDPRARKIRFSLFVDDGADRSEPVDGELNVAPGPLEIGVPLQVGLNLLSVPLDPSTTGHPFDAADLLEAMYGRADSGFVVRSLDRTNNSTAPIFDVYLPGLITKPFAIEGNQGYLVGGQSGPLSGYVTGSPWPAGSVRRSFARGVNLLALPAGVPSGYDAAQLAQATGARVVVRLLPSGRFQVYLPGVSDSFPLAEGEAYLLSAPAAKTVTLPAGQ
ncbi:MAG: DVUA0089 family protein, partial [Candidatus Wallbacteria bacterium]|nr:DVUA0089 family protein [Candidatus Wallbacteria bacterium]